MSAADLREYRKNVVCFDESRGYYTPEHANDYGDDYEYMVSPHDDDDSEGETNDHNVDDVVPKVVAIPDCDATASNNESSVEDASDSNRSLYNATKRAWEQYLACKDRSQWENLVPNPRVHRCKRVNTAYCVQLKGDKLKTTMRYIQRLHRHRSAFAIGKRTSDMKLALQAFYSKSDSILAKQKQLKDAEEARLAAKRAHKSGNHRNGPFVLNEAARLFGFLYDVEYRDQIAPYFQKSESRRTLDAKNCPGGGRATFANTLGKLFFDQSLSPDLPDLDEKNEKSNLYGVDPNHGIDYGRSESSLCFHFSRLRSAVSAAEARYNKSGQGDYQDFFLYSTT